jgi:uncharacterized protein
MPRNSSGCGVEEDDSTPNLSIGINPSSKGEARNRPKENKEMLEEQYCVYNPVRETFLSLAVVAANTTFARLKGLIGRLKLRSDEGLWVVPSRGIHTIGVFFPIDLVYLDQDYRVIHIVESFPAFRVAPWRNQAASVLQLPTHTIYSSQTQVGDQLLICMANEMAQQLRVNIVPPGEQTMSERVTGEPNTSEQPQGMTVLRMTARQG